MMSNVGKHKQYATGIFSFSFLLLSFLLIEIGVCAGEMYIPAVVCPRVTNNNAPRWYHYGVRVSSYLLERLNLFYQNILL